MEKERNQELLSEVSELNEAIMRLKQEAAEKEKEMRAIISEKEAELDLARAAVAEALKELENLRNQWEVMQGLGNQLIQGAGLAPKSGYELENLKKELATATSRIGEFRRRAEMAVSRAEAAEKAKVGLEDQIRKWQEQRERRRAAQAALREVSFSKQGGEFRYERTPQICQPLGTVLNIEF